MVSPHILTNKNRERKKAKTGLPIHYYILEKMLYLCILPSGTMPERVNNTKTAE